jgi:hypothetical protein
MKTFNNCFTEFLLPEWFDGPEDLKETLRKVWDKQYSDLYDEGGNCDVYDAFKDVLEAFGMPDNVTGHKRYMYMGWAIALAASFTLKGWFPEDERPEIALEQVRSWLKQGTEVPLNLADTLFSDYHQKGAHTAAGEAYTVFYRFLKTLDQTQAYQNLLWMLDDAFTGEALTLQHLERREFFNWWVIDVTPSAYCLRFPSYLCTAGGIMTLDEKF